MKLIRVGLFVAVFANIVGCTPTLKEWVKERGFEYDMNYSTINKLGNRVLADGVIQPNPYLAVQGERGKLPKIEDEKKRTFKIEGEADASNFIEGVASGSVKGDFSKVSKLVVVLDNPYTERVQNWAPRGPCQQHVAISETINTGNMSIRLEDKTGVNLTGGFSLEGNPASVKVSGGAGTERVLKISGQDFYVGYKTINRLCTSLAKKSLLLRKGAQYTDEQLGIDAMFLEHRIGSDGIPEVLVYFSAIPQVHKKSGVNVEHFSEVSEAVSSIKALSTIVSSNKNIETELWDKATVVRPELINSYVVGNEGVVLRAKYGAGIGLSTGEDGLYVRIGKTENDTLTIHGERIALSRY